MKSQIPRDAIYMTMNLKTRIERHIDAPQSQRRKTLPPFRTSSIYLLVPFLEP